MEHAGTVCARCGACLPNCPVYRNTLLERLGPRGKHEILHGGRADFSWPSVRETVSACLQCGACEASCSAGIAVNREILQARAGNREFSPSWPMLWRLFSSNLAWASAYGFLSSLPAAAGILYRLAALSASLRGKDIVCAVEPAATPLLSSKGIRDFHEKNARTAHGISMSASASVHACQSDLDGLSLPVQDGRGRDAAGDSGHRGPSIAMFVGCVQNFIYPEVPVSMAAWFPHARFVIPPGQCCCGLPALSAGAVESARRLIMRNLKAFADSDADVILTGCASCTYMIRKWPEIMEHDKNAARQARGVAERVVEFTEYWHQQDFRGLDTVPATGVTFHAPCHSRFSAEGTVAAEAFLNHVLGRGFVPMGQGCCGLGGSFSMRHPQISLNIFRERIAALERCGAETVVTNCSGCLLQWRAMCSMEVSDAPAILHVAELGRLSEQS